MVVGILMMRIQIPTLCTIVFHTFQRTTKILTHIRTPLSVGTGTENTIGEIRIDLDLEKETGDVLSDERTSKNDEPLYRTYHIRSEDSST